MIPCSRPAIPFSFSTLLVVVWYNFSLSSALSFLRTSQVASFVNVSAVLGDRPGRARPTPTHECSLIPPFFNATH
ncbi:hypothetical protein BV22DRAFT_1041345 [Leucogyrophana mollusca]|uniref:Uncharacterized protein n=1 Tax=Leucogyrophana mollusca TaxID=85980 RepID=A0ACB8B1G9_9AGAM|nr:hypothetical protein BV22DRAFT_1041345 [Leucogyrophana mollusca]